MSHLLERAECLLEAAGAAAEAGGGATGWTYYFDPQGGVRMVAAGGSDAPLDAFCAERGARAAWRITNSGGRIRVEGREGQQRCTVERAAPRLPATRVLSSARLYALTAVPHRAETARLLPAAWD